jgi:hypothetical protein
MAESHFGGVRRTLRAGAGRLHSHATVASIKGKPRYRRLRLLKKLPDWLLSVDPGKAFDGNRRMSHALSQGRPEQREMVWAEMYVLQVIFHDLNIDRIARSVTGSGDC